MNKPEEGSKVTSQTEAGPADVLSAESGSKASISQAAPLLMGVKLPIRVLMGHTDLTLRDIARLGSGSVVELDCSPDDPVEILVNDRVIAHGEIVVVAGNYGVRITQIAPDQGSGQSGSKLDLLGLSERLK